MPYLTREVVVRGNRGHVEFSPDWAVRSMFGGALAAATVRATRAVLDRELYLADALFAFLAPTPPGHALIEVTPHRAGRRRASVSVSIESGGVKTVHGMLTLTASPPRRSIGGLAPVPGPEEATHHAFGGGTAWLPVSPVTPGRFDAWVRATGAAASLPDDEWTCIAVDLIGPAVLAERPEPFAIATASLSITVLGSALASSWQRQTVTAYSRDDVAIGELELRDSAGQLTARAHQQAALLPTAESDLPRSVTAFADSSHGSRLIGMN